MNNLHRGTQPKRRRRPAAEGDALSRRMHVGDEHPGRGARSGRRPQAAEFRDQQSAPEKLLDARDADEHQGTREIRRDHPRQVMSHPVEAGRRGEDEHHGQGIAGRIPPGGEGVHASRPHGPEGESRCQQHDQDDHKKPESISDDAIMPQLPMPLTFTAAAVNVKPETGSPCALPWSGTGRRNPGRKGARAWPRRRLTSGNSSRPLGMQ